MSTSSDNLSEFSESESDVRVQTSHVMLTRKQTMAQAELKKADQVAIARSGATPVCFDKIGSTRSKVVDGTCRK